MIDARGSGEPQGVSLMFQIALERILANNTGAVSQSVVYPAGFDQNVTAGVQNVADLIRYGLQDCPDQQYFLFGYSQGATVVLEALDKLDDNATAAVNSIVLVGNPYRIPGRLSNVDSHGRVDNRTAFGLFATQSMHSNSSIPTYNEDYDRSGKVRDICLEVSFLSKYSLSISNHDKERHCLCCRSRVRLSACKRPHVLWADAARSRPYFRACHIANVRAWTRHSRRIALRHLLLSLCVSGRECGI